MNLGFLKALEPLPSSTSAADLIEGKPGSLGRAFLHTVGRATLIGTGLYAAGYRGKDLVKGSIAASLAIEAFALVWFASQKSSSKDA